MSPAKFYIPSRTRRNADKAIGAGEYPLAIRSAVIPTRLFIKAMLEGKPYQPKAAMFVLTNPIISYPNSQDTYQALMKLDFIAVSELFMTPTAAVADIVLPASTGRNAEVGYRRAGTARSGILKRRAAGECWADT
jgi:anaerobic selenocysteine-containing dehydrogenase